MIMDNIDEVTDKHLKALKEIEKDKLRVARSYNKKVKLKSFQVGDLVWKTILPLGMKSNKFSNYLPNLLLFIPRDKIIFQTRSST